MNDYSDQTLTVDDLATALSPSGRHDERGSTFTNCTFDENGSSVPIDDIDFSYATFTNCTWDCIATSCSFLSAEGDLPAKTEITFDAAPDDGELFEDSINVLFKGDGSTAVFEILRTDETDLRAVIEATGLTADDYTLVMGKADYDCNLLTGELTRTQWFAQTTLELTTDATDTADPIDGIPDISADGVSSCTLYIKKKSKLGNYLTGASHTDQIDLSCTRGKLSAIRVNLVNGEAEITFTSVAETCVSDIVANSEDMSATIQIQFAP